MIPTPPVPRRIETARLLLSAVAPRDSADFHAACAVDPLYRRWMSWWRETGDDQGAVCAFLERLAWDWTNGRDHVYALRRRGDGLFCGAAGLHLRDAAVPAWEIGFWGAPAARGQGLVGEAAAALVALARRLGAERVMMTCDAGNERSARLIGHLGLACEGRLRHARRRNDGSLADTLLFAWTN